MCSIFEQQQQQEFNCSQIRGKLKIPQHCIAKVKTIAFMQRYFSLKHAKEFNFSQPLCLYFEFPSSLQFYTMDTMLRSA